MQRQPLKIPIVVVPLAKPGRLHPLLWRRRAAQALFILLLLLIPISGLFRVDPLAGAFVVLDRQIWFGDFFLVFGLWMMLSCSLVFTYSLVGTAFCGWACPQNTLSEWGNQLMQKLLGKHAKLEVDGASMAVALRKNKLLNWIVLYTLYFVAALAFALIPLFYFFDPATMGAFIAWQTDARLPPSIHWIYAVFVMVLFLDIAFIRHFWCRFMCVYRVWQHTFKTKNTLGITYDSSRAAECEKCNYCVTACFIDLDPRKTDVYDSCINCGACIVACDKMHTKTGGNGLLRFAWGGQVLTNSLADRAKWTLGKLGSLFSRAQWVLLIFSLGMLLFLWGINHYQPLHAGVYQVDGRNHGGEYRYQINLANKLYQPTAYSVAVTGIPPQFYHLPEREVYFDTVGRKKLLLTFATDMVPGFYPFTVNVTDRQGRTVILKGQHVVTREGKIR